MISTKTSSSAALTHQNDAADEHFELAMHAMVLQRIRQKEAAKSHRAYQEHITGRAYQE